VIVLGNGSSQRRFLFTSGTLCQRPSWVARNVRFIFAVTVVAICNGIEAAAVSGAISSHASVENPTPDRGTARAHLHDPVKNEMELKAVALNSRASGDPTLQKCIPAHSRA
jgi:hypothetical protein